MESNTQGEKNDIILPATNVDKDFSNKVLMVALILFLIIRI